MIRLYNVVYKEFACTLLFTKGSFVHYCLQRIRLYNAVYKVLVCTILFTLIKQMVIKRKYKSNI